MFASWALALVAVSAALVTAVAVLRSPVYSLAGPNPSAQRTCGPSGCAVVSLSRALPPTTVLYGASCSGINGPWFFNAVEGGGNDELRPSYSLTWSFESSSTVAKPSGHVAVAPTSSAQVAVTVKDGAIGLTGTKKPNVKVAAAGTLVVEISGSKNAPVLKFTETGLLKEENALGLVSPFDVGGNPLIVPVATVKTMTGC